MKKIWKFISQYKLFVGATIGTIVAGAVAMVGYSHTAHWLLIVIIALELIPLLIGMVNDVREGKYGVDILAATAIITAVVMREYWASVVIVLMLTGGESLEDYAEYRAHRELNALLERAPRKAQVIRKHKEFSILASEVRVGDTVIIKPGEVVPVDAQILEGTASFDESGLTGESLPQIRKRSDTILSGTINQDGAITAKALATAANSQYEQIIKLVQTANHSQAPYVRLADKYALPFTVISFGIAIAAWVISREPLRFLEVLVVATPCPLILAAPIAVISGMSRAAKQGIIIKTGSALEKLATAKTFAFDKTGTLTLGTPQVDRIQVFGTFTKSDIISFAAAVEQSSNHVLAQAILTKATMLHVSPKKAKHVKELVGNGLSGRVGAKEIIVGRLGMLEDSDIIIPKTFATKAVQSTAAFVAISGKLAGIITFKDEVRPETKQTLKDLVAMGVQSIIMITGDNATIASRLARNLGIKQVEADALPGDKIRVLERVQTRPVVFVGDGVNDAPALMASDLGIALGARGSTAASESADIVIMLEGIGYVAESRKIALRTFAIAKQSILVGIGLSIILMFIFATGTFRPIYGAFIQELVDIVVICNALRAHSER